MAHLCEKNKCTGCTACVVICPKQCVTMQQDEEGFAYPAVNNEICVGCGVCEKSCPVLNVKEQQQEPTAYAAYSKDDALRLESSSGGVFTELAKAVLNQGGVVFGAAYDEKFRVYHICVDNEGDLARIRGAKYAQSNLGDTFRQVRRFVTDRKVLFVGTPCQVAGVKAYLGTEGENLISVDFVCHSVPSPMAWEKYIEYRAQTDNDGIMPVAINFRCKDTGWSRYSNQICYGAGKQNLIKSADSLFMKLFVGDYINRLSCENCSFKGYSRVSDLTIGDFWGIWDIAPEMDDNRGTSVVLVQSEKGRKIFDEISDRLAVMPVTLKQASQQNPSMLVSSKAKENRSQVLDTIRSGNIAECSELFKPEKLSMAARVKNKVAGLARRAAAHLPKH